jgi:hypothetical protein
LAFTARLTVAQEVRLARAIHGVVIDSVAGRPLAGAVVQVAVPGSPSAPWTAATDSAGRYRISGLPAGKVVVGFYHDALTALGLDAPTRGLELAGEGELVVDLSIPSSATIRALRCGESPEFAAGMLVGFVRDARDRGVIAGTKLTVHWRAFALDSGDYRVVTERRSATVEADGSYLVCHLPVDAPLDLLATAPAHRDLAGAVVNIPTTGIGTLDLHLVDSALVQGNAIIRGRVQRESGRVVSSGRAVIKALGRDVPITNGAFVAAGVPAGSWVAEARVIGVEPQEVLVTAVDGQVTNATVAVSNGPQRLDAVTVIGKMDHNLRVLDDVLRRGRIGMGTTFLPDHPALRSATFVSDVMREARGFLYQGPNKILGRAGLGGRCTDVAVYVDDVRIPDGFAGLDHWASPKDVLAIETWPDIRLAPVQYRHLTKMSILGLAPRPKLTPLPEPPTPNARACALVLVWTRRNF